MTTPPPRIPKTGKLDKRAAASRPAKRDVLAAIKQAGYPLEQRVAEVADSYGFLPTSSWTWRDGENERELDVVGELIVPSVILNLSVHVLIECKRFINGVVFFESRHTSAKEASHYFADNVGKVHFWGQPESVLSKSSPGIGYPTPQHFGWSTKRWPPAGAAAYQYAVLQHNKKHSDKGYNPWVLDQEESHGSINGLCRGLLSYRKEVGLVAPGVKHPFMNFAVLLVVVEGPLHVYRAPGPGKRAGLRRADHVTYFRQGFEAQSRVVYRIDFVQERALGRFLAELAETAEAMATDAEGIAGRLTKSVSVFHRPSR